MSSSIWINFTSVKFVALQYIRWYQNYYCFRKLNNIFAHLSTTIKKVFAKHFFIGVCKTALPRKDNGSSGTLAWTICLFQTVKVLTLIAYSRKMHAQAYTHAHIHPKKNLDLKRDTTWILLQDQRLDYFFLS